MRRSERVLFRSTRKPTKGATLRGAVSPSGRLIILVRHMRYGPSLEAVLPSASGQPDEWVVVEPG